MKRLLTLAGASLFTLASFASGDVDYSVISVPEERGIEFTCMTQANDYVAMPSVKRRSNRVEWLTNRIINLSPDGKHIAFLSVRDGKSNIFIKEVGKVQGATQRTNRSKVMDFNYSPDGKEIAFSEDRGNGYQIFVTDANTGFVCRQLTSSAQDYSPVFSPDKKTIYFARAEDQGSSIWSCTVDNGMLSSYTSGLNPSIVKLADGSTAILCTRINGEGNGEIWLFDAAKGTEKCVISDLEHSFTTPALSPDGRWIVCTGSSAIPLDDKGRKYYHNTDIYLVSLDGSLVRQLTFHAANDLSPVWSPDGKFIYFISERGNAEGRANVWRIPFNAVNFI